MVVTHLLYLHGFRSSPHSAKATLLAAHVAQHHRGVRWWCPQQPASPQAAMDLVLNGVRNWPVAQMAVVGSSLGGFYATYVAERLGCKAVLLNPAVDPARDLMAYVGTHTVWQQPELSLFFAPHYVPELQALTLESLSHMERYWTLIAKGDEVLDWREMTARYAGAPGLLLEGGDHALSDFAVHLPALCEFLRLSTATIKR